MLGAGCRSPWRWERRSPTGTRGAPRRARRDSTEPGGTSVGAAPLQWVPGGSARTRSTSASSTAKGWSVLGAGCRSPWRWDAGLRPARAALRAAHVVTPPSLAARRSARRPFSGFPAGVPGTSASSAGRVGPCSGPGAGVRGVGNAGLRPARAALRAAHVVTPPSLAARRSARRPFSGFPAGVPGPGPLPLRALRRVGPCSGPDAGVRGGR